MTPDLFRVLLDLHAGVFSPDLLNQQIVGFNAEKRLSRVEYYIVDLKIGGMSNDEVCSTLKLKKSSLKTRLREIESKYRNQGLDLRVDDWKNLRKYLKEQKGIDKTSTKAKTK